MKIDIHTHIMPRDIPRWVEKFGYGKFVHLEDCGDCRARMMVGDKFFREVESNCWDPVVRMHECDTHGVHKQVLSIIPVLFYYWAKGIEGLETSRFFNDYIAEVVSRHPDRFIGLGTIPLQDPQLAIQEMEKKYQLRCANVFHAGDGNLHPLILFDANDPDQLHRCELFGADILETSVAMGGTVTGEHGVGVEKLNSMCVQFSQEENAQMFGVKQAFDPRELLNPGKVIPTLQRCAEYGKMLVRAGQIKHPDLPRF